MNKLLLSAFVSLLLLPSCDTIKTIKMINDGEVEQKEFNVTIPFEYRLGLIVLKVTISGEEYDFLLDTGAPNVLSEKLAQKLELDNITEQNVGDSQGESDDLGFTTIEKLSIGGIHFLNTGAAIADLSLSKDVACLKVDGLVGSNLMKRAIWKFDYQNQLITITSSLDSLNLPISTQKVSFSTEFVTKRPLLNIKLNDVKEKKITIDLGSNGDIILSKDTYDALMEKHSSIAQARSYGSAASGLYGMGEIDSSYITHYVKVPNVSFGDISLENTIVMFTDKTSSTIGTDFFKNYDLVMNWFTKEMLLVEKEKYDNSTLSTLGFVHSNQENRLIVSKLYENNKSLELGDQILTINDVNYAELSEGQWCDILENELSEKEKEEISIRILRDGKELSYTLKKIDLL